MQGKVYYRRHAWLRLRLRSRGAARRLEGTGELILCRADLRLDRLNIRR